MERLITTTSQVIMHRPKHGADEKPASTFWALGTSTRMRVNFPPCVSSLARRNFECFIHHRSSILAYVSVEPARARGREHQYFKAVKFRNWQLALCMYRIHFAFVPTVCISRWACFGSSLPLLFRIPEDIYDEYWFHPDPSTETTRIIIIKATNRSTTKRKCLHPLGRESDEKPPDEVLPGCVSRVVDLFTC